MIGIVFALAFILAADEKALTGVFSRPLVACAITAALLGNLQTGISVGMMLEVYALAADRGGFSLSHFSFVLASVAGTALAVQASSDYASVSTLTAALAAISAAVSYGSDILCTVLLPMARKAADKHAAGTVGALNLAGLLIRCVLFGACTAAIVSLGTDASAQISAITSRYGWALSACRAAGCLMPGVGFAILLRNLSVKEIPGALFAGLAVGIVFAALQMNSAGLAAAGCAGFAMASFSLGTKAEPVKEIKTEKKTVKGGDDEWWRE